MVSAKGYGEAEESICRSGEGDEEKGGEDVAKRRRFWA
jgi:hypothetical protein